MFHRFIAVLLVAVSLFLHTAPVVMAQDASVFQDGGGEVEVTGSVQSNNGVPTFTPDATLADLDGSIQIGVAKNVAVDKMLGIHGLWYLPDLNEFFADKPYLSQLICMTPGFISDLLNIAAGIFGVLGPFLGILGVFVSDPSNTITNIQQLMTMTQQLKSMFEQCKNQKRINSVLGTTAQPAQLGIFMAHALGRYGSTSFQASVRSNSPQWFGSGGFNSPKGILIEGLNAFSTVNLFTGAIGEITGDKATKEIAKEMADKRAKSESLINAMFAIEGIFTNAFKQMGANGKIITKSQQMLATVRGVMGQLIIAENPDLSREDAEKKAGEDLDNWFAARLNELQGGGSDGDGDDETIYEDRAGKVKNTKDKGLKGLSGGGLEAQSAAIITEMQILITKLLTGRGSNEPKATCEVTVTRYRLEAARNCALKCAATSLNYVNNNAIKVQQLVSNSGGCVVAGQNLPKSLCPTLTDVVANSGSVRGDIQSLVAIEFYGLTADLAMGEVTALCSACEGIKALIGTPTECQ